MAQHKPGKITSSININDHGHAEWGSEFIDILNHFQADGIDYLYDLEPQSNNLFYAGFFRESDKQGGPQQRPFFNAAYRIKSVSWNGPSLSFEHDPRTHLPKMKSKEYDVSLTVEWHEDVYHSVKRYHLNWIQRWYNRGFDCLRCGPEGKFRRMAVVLFHYVNASEASDASVIEVPVARPLMVFDFGGLVPEKFGDWKFSYDSDDNDAALSITYKAARVSWYYGKNIASEGHTDYIWQQSTTSMRDDPNSAQIWNPSGYYSDNANAEVGDKNHAQLERLRIARTATSFISDEATLG